MNCFVVPKNWIRDIVISSEDIIQAIHLIPDKLTRSPNGISAFFWKRIFFSIFNLLWLLFSLCLLQGTRHSPFNGNLLLLYPFIKKALEIIQVTTAQFFSPVSYVVFWSISLLINYFIIFTVTIFFLLISLAFYLVVLIADNYLPSYRYCL